MPTVPRSTAPSVAPTRSPVAGVTPLQYSTARGASLDAFGGGVAQADARLGASIAGVGDIAAQQALVDMEEDNQRWAKQRYVQFATEAQKLLNGDGSKENPGFFSQTGENAIAANKATKEAMLKLREQIASESENGRVKEMFGLQADSRILQDTAAIDGHTAKERKIANQTASDARLATAVSDASMYYESDTALERATLTAAAEVTQQAEMQGWSDDTTRQKATEARTAVVAGAVKAAIGAEDAERATTLLEKNAGLISGPVYAELSKAVRATALETRAQSLAEKALAQFPDYGKDPTAALAWIRDNSTGREETAAVAELNRRLGEVRGQEDRAWTEKQRRQAEDDRAYTLTMRANEIANAEWTKQERNRTIELRSISEGAFSAIEGGASYSSLPQDQILKLPEETRRALRTREQQIASGEPVLTDYKRFTQISNMNAEELADLDLAVERTRLSDPVFDMVVKLQLAAGQGKLDPKSQYSPTQFFNTRADALGLVGSDKADERGKLNILFQEEVEAFKAGSPKNKAPNSVEMQKIWNDITAPIEIERSIFGRGFGITREQPVYEAYSRISEKDKTRLTEGFKARGITPTAKQIVRARQLELEQKGK